MKLLINIDVEDVSKAVVFYTAAFGLSVGRRFDAEWVELIGGEAPIYLLGKKAGTAPAPGVAARSYGRHWTPVHLDIAVADLDPLARSTRE